MTKLIVGLLVSAVTVTACIPPVQTNTNVNSHVNVNGDAMMDDKSDNTMMEGDKMKEGDAMMEAKAEGDVMLKADTEVMMKDEGDTSASGDTMSDTTSRATYEPFTLAAYNKAKDEGRPIYLYFSANWCPTCRAQEPILQELFSSGDLDDTNVAAFRVNYNDTETDASEKALAEQLGVTYQHTMFMFNADGQLAGKVVGSRTRAQLISDINAGI